MSFDYFLDLKEQLPPTNKEGKLRLFRSISGKLGSIDVQDSVLRNLHPIIPGIPESSSVAIIGTCLLPSEIST
jgi:hypothetical protein